MAISKKGSRQIEVEDINYRYRVSVGKKWFPRVIHLLIWADDAKGAVLNIEVESYNSDFFTPVIRPAIVREQILAALNEGWKPLEPGAEFAGKKLRAPKQEYDYGVPENLFFKSYPLNPEQSWRSWVACLDRATFWRARLAAIEVKKRKVHLPSATVPSDYWGRSEIIHIREAHKKLMDFCSDYSDSASPESIARKFVEAGKLCLLWGFCLEMTGGRYPFELVPGDVGEFEAFMMRMTGTRSEDPEKEGMKNLLAMREKYLPQLFEVKSDLWLREIFVLGNEKEGNWMLVVKDGDYQYMP